MSLFDRRTLRWSLFDFASSTFAAPVPPFFGLYFVAVVAPAHPGSVAVLGRQPLALVTLLATLTAGVALLVIPSSDSVELLPGGCTSLLP